MKTLMVMAGGTGGHVFPALAVAEYLRDKGVRIVWLGTRAGIEARLVPEREFEIRWMKISGLRGKGLCRLLSMPFLLVRALMQGLRIVWREKPDALLGMGGFASGPGAISGWLLRKPLLIHEANASAGFTNRLLAPLARRVMTGFPDTEGLPGKAEWCGNPVRPEMSAIEAKANGENGFNILVFGGSQGARVFNTRLPGVLGPLSASAGFHVRHQCGRGNTNTVEDAYGEFQGNVEVEEFIDDMTAAYAWADLVVCRAGAMTVAELCCAGRAAILVPFPHAVGDHQSANARFIADQDAGILLAESQLEEQALAELIQNLGADRARLRSMAARARKLARADATQVVGDACMEVMHA